MGPKAVATLAEDETGATSQPIETYLEQVADEEALPELAVRVCTARAEEAAPALLAALERAAEGAALDKREARLLVRGLHVLGAAREPRAFAPFLQLLTRMSPQELDELFGDVLLIETVPRIAVGVFDGDTDALFAAIGSGVPDAQARDSLLRAATFLAWEGRIDRARMEDFLTRFFEVPLAADDDVTWLGWLDAIALLGLRSLTPLVDRAYEQDLGLDDYCDPREFEARLVATERAPDDITQLDAHNTGYIKDVVLALNRGSEAVSLIGVAEADKRIDLSGTGQASNPMRGVGRNDPCPCGSGKKAKKCCMA